MIVSGLTAIPVSTAEVTRRRLISPLSSTSHSTTVAMKLANAICAATPRPQRAGSGVPQPDFSRTRSSAACNRGVLSKCARILARLTCQLLDEALDGEHVVVWADAAPEARDDARWLFPIEFHASVGNVVGNVLRGVD